MQYLGGKTRIARELAGVMLSGTSSRQHYWEPFIGGGNVFQHMAPEFTMSTGSDVHEDLILMWQALADGWEPPEQVTEEDYRRLRHEDPSALRAFAGFGCSFGGKWFAGYGRGNVSAATSRRSVMKQVALMTRGGSHLEFRQASYHDVRPAAGTVIYCDPPYAGTTGYKGTGAFSHEDLWEHCERWARSGCDVFVSEYECPAKVTWEREHYLALSGGINKATARRTERLFKF